VTDVAEALDLARLDDTADFGSQVASDEIDAVESHLGVRFPAAYRDFVTRTGWCSFGGREFYGITPRGIAATSVPSVAFATRKQREHGLPDDLLVIENSGAEELYVLDVKANDDHYGTVKVWIPGSDRQKLEQLAPDFGAYLLAAARDATSS
jgi:hypothetical protein